MGARSEELFQLTTDVLLKARLDDGQRFKQLVLEAKSGAEARVVGSGHSVASVLLGSQFSAAGWADEQMGGLSNLLFLRELAQRCDADWASVAADLEAIRGALLGRAGCVLNLTGDEATLGRASAAAAGMLAALPAQGGQRVAWSQRGARANTLVTVPTQVNYVGKAADLYAAGYALHGSSYVVNKLARRRPAPAPGAAAGACERVRSCLFFYLFF